MFVSQVIEISSAMNKVKSCCHCRPRAVFRLLVNLHGTSNPYLNQEQFARQTSFFSVYMNLICINVQQNIIQQYCNGIHFLKKRKRCFSKLKTNKLQAYTVALTDFFRRKKMNCVHSFPFHQGPHHQLPPSSIQLARDIVRNGVQTLKNVALKIQRSR